MIRAARKARRLTQGNLAGLLNQQSGWNTCTANDVYRWETNRRTPGPWLPSLVEVLDLDLTTTSEATSGTLPPPPPTVVIEPPALPDEDDVLRRDLLRCLTVTAALIAVPGATEPADPAHTAVGQVAETGGAMAATLWQAHSLAGSKQAVYPLVADHMGRLTAALDATGREGTRRQLCIQVASVYQLAGEIRFDASRYTDAAHCYSIAASAAREAGDRDLWACALVRHAYAELYADRPKAAVQLLAAAARLAQHGDPSLATRYWVAAVQAEAYAALRDLTQCQRALGRAEEVHALAEPPQNSGWLRFDGSRLAEERGTCYLALDRPDLAEEALTVALTQTLSARRQGAVLAELAVLGAQRGDLDGATEHARNALDLAGQTSSGFIGHKLAVLEAALVPYAADRRVSELHHRIAALPAATNRRSSP